MAKSEANKKNLYDLYNRMSGQKSLKYHATHYARVSHGDGAHTRAETQTFDKVTDSDIFALDDAAACAGLRSDSTELPDAIFNDVELPGEGVYENTFGDGYVVIPMPQQKEQDEGVAGGASGADRKSSLKTLLKTIPDGRKVHNIVQVNANYLYIKG